MGYQNTISQFVPSDLTDDDEHWWFEIASDSAFPSFVKLPLEDRTILAPGAKIPVRT
jgi:hypothetical protein